MIRSFKKWSEDPSHNQYENAKALLKSTLPQEGFEKLVDHFWSCIKVLFCINNGAGHELPKAKFRPQVVVMDQAGRAKVLNSNIPLSGWRNSINKVIMAGDVRQPNPDRPVLPDDPRNEMREIFGKSVLEQNTVARSDYKVIHLEDE